MIWIIISSLLVFIISAFWGAKKPLYLDQVTESKFFISLILFFAISFSLRVLQNFGLFSEALGGAIITGTYASASAFFFGSAYTQFHQKVNSGDFWFANRSFISEHLPNIIAIGILLFGIYRTSIFSELAVTPIRVSSGLSLIALGFWGLTIRWTPEFRSEGIIILDRLIIWDDFLTFKWTGEETLEIKYEQNDHIKSFQTIIDSDDRKKIESILAEILLNRVGDENKSESD